jgi:hypothetical protein
MGTEVDRAVQVSANVIAGGYELAICTIGRQPFEELKLQRLICRPGRREYTQGLRKVNDSEID